MEYSDIIEHPHHVSTRRKRMSNKERASQFLSFRALEGLEATLAETRKQSLSTYEAQQSAEDIDE